MRVGGIKELLQGRLGWKSLHSVYMYETPQRIQLKDGRKICQLADH